MKKDAVWEWSDTQHQAFVELMEQLCSAPVLQLPDSYRPFTLTTDWGQRGMGVVLSQLDPKGVEHPICYASRSCDLAEQNYNSFDGECLAAWWCGRQTSSGLTFLATHSLSSPTTSRCGS